MPRRSDVGKGERNSDLWWLLESGAGASAFNMALDHALLELAPGLGRPVLRFYGWTEPAASFGYFQRIAEVERATALRPLVRRPTGGGLVPHDADWTYSVTFPPSHPWYHLRAEESYARIHQWLQAAFATLGTSTELATGRRTTAPGQCFAGYEKSDLLWLGRKIAGAAQRRTRTGLLIQGSVQPPPGLKRQEWERAMCDTTELEVCATTSGFDHRVRWESLAVSGELADAAVALSAQRYSQEAYNQRR